MASEKTEEALRKARRICFEKMKRGEIPFFNFHYRMLLNDFQILNMAAIEAEDDEVVLEDFSRVNKFFSRTIKDKSYETIVRNAFYCALTILRRIGRNYIFELTGQWSFLFPSFLNFALEDKDAEYERGLREWMNRKMVDDPYFRAQFDLENN